MTISWLKAFIPVITAIMLPVTVAQGQERNAQAADAKTEGCPSSKWETSSQSQEEKGEISSNKDINRLDWMLKNAGKEPLILTELNLSNAIVTRTSLRGADLTG